VKILVCGINYYPELTGIGKYSGEMAAWLAGKGHDVRVVTAPPYYPQWKVQAGYSTFFYKQERINGVRIWRCPIYIPGQLSGLKRIIHLLSFAISSMPVMFRQGLWRPDVIISIEPPLFCAPVSWLVARLVGGKCLLHVQDMEIDVAFSLGILSSGWMQRWVAAMERWMMRRFDAVSTISTSMLGRLQDKGVEKERLLLFPNWADIANVRFNPEGRKSFRDDWKVGKQCRVALYSGNMAVKQGLDLIIHAAERLQDKNLLFVICGTGPAKAKLEDMASIRRLINVRFMSLQPVDKLAALLSAADVHLVVQTAGAADLVMPSKHANILAVGGYSIVTASTETELGQLITNNPQLGLLCPPDNVEEFIKTMLVFLEQGEVQKSKQIRNFAEAGLGKNMILSAFENALAVLTKSSAEKF